MKRILIFTLVSLVACVAAWSIARAFIGTSLTSKEFPLSEKWVTKLQGDIEQLTIIDHSLLVVRTMSKIYALDMSSGEIVWQQRIAWHFSYQPIFAQKGLLFLTDGKDVLALDQLDGKILWKQPLRYPANADVVAAAQNLVAVNDPPYLVVYQAVDGTLLWVKDVCREKVQAYFFDTNIVVPCYGLNVLDASSGEIVWETQPEDATGRIWDSAFADGVIYFSWDIKELTAYDVKNRQQLWKAPLAEEYRSFQPYEVIQDLLAVKIKDQLCILHRGDGRNAWCIADLTKPKNPTSFEGILYLFNGLQKGITAYDLRDGSQVGRLDFPAYNFTPFENDKQLMVASDTFLIFADKNQIYAYGK